MTWMRFVLLCLVLALSCTVSLQAQRMDTVMVDEKHFETDSLPLPGTAFPTAKFSFKVREGATKGAVLAFYPAKVGKFKDVRFLVQVKQGEVLGTGLQVNTEKQVKAIRKYLVKKFGSPYQLRVTKSAEVLEWRAHLEQPYQIMMRCNPEDTFGFVWITLK